MGKQRDAGGIGTFGHAHNQVRDLVGAALQRVHQLEKILAAQAGAVDHRADLGRRSVRIVGRQHVIVESERVDLALVEPAARFRLGVEVECLEAQMIARIGGKPRL